MPLSDRDIRRIVREVDSVKGVDAVGLVEEASPWFRLLDPPILRLSKALAGLGVFHVLYGFRPLPLYGVPHIGRDRVFAARADSEDLRKVFEGLSRAGFGVLSRSDDGARLLDLERYVVIDLVSRPGSLSWDERMAERCLERSGVKILSAEDYTVSLLSRGAGVMALELAGKVIYANLDRLDRGYLMARASQASVEEAVRGIVERLEAASR